MRERPPEVVLREQAAHLAFLATERLYEEQPELWEMGERGRFHTHQDFGYHFRALAEGPDAFRSHVEYSRRLFAERGFPARWLSDAWRVMSDVCRSELPPEAGRRALETLEVIDG